MRCKAVIRSSRAASIRAFDDGDPHCRRNAVVRGYCRQHSKGVKTAPKVYCQGKWVRTVLVGRLPVCPRCATPLPWLIR